MNTGNTTCSKCGAEVISQTNFCRQCGAAVATSASEEPTSILEGPQTAATKHLSGRETSPAPTQTQLSKRRSGKWLVITTFVATICLALVVAMFVRHKTRSSSVEGLMYPGASKVMDIVAEGGGRAVQLETADNLSKVENWYKDSLNADKVIRLSAGSVVIKNEKTTATLVSAENKTNILLKIVP